MEYAFRSASSIHHKNVLVIVLVLRCKVLVLVLNTKPTQKCLGLGLEIKVLVLVLKKVLITSLRSTKFKCSADHAKRSFFRAATGVFAKVGRLASEEVILEVVKCKRLPVLLYGLEVCALDKRALQSLDFSFNRFFACEIIQNY